MKSIQFYASKISTHTVVFIAYKLKMNRENCNSRL